MDYSDYNEHLRFRKLPLRNYHKMAVGLQLVPSEMGKSEGIYKDREIGFRVTKRVRHSSDANVPPTYSTHT